jgi:hypothetical protein
LQGRDPQGARKTPCRQCTKHCRQGVFLFRRRAASSRSWRPCGAFAASFPLVYNRFFRQAKYQAAPAFIRISCSEMELPIRHENYWSFNLKSCRVFALQIINSHGKLKGKPSSRGIQASIANTPKTRRRE